MVLHVHEYDLAISFKTRQTIGPVRHVGNESESEVMIQAIVVIVALEGPRAGGVRVVTATSSMGGNRTRCSRRGRWVHAT